MERPSERERKNAGGWRSHGDGWRANGEWGALDVRAMGTEVLWGDAEIERERVKHLDAIADARRDASLAAACEMATAGGGVLAAAAAAKKRKEKPLSGKELEILESAKVVMWAYNAPLRQISTRYQRYTAEDIESARKRLVAAPTTPSPPSTRGGTTNDVDAGGARGDAACEPPSDGEDEPVDLSDGLVVGGYRGLVVERAAEGVDVRLNQIVTSVSYARPGPATMDAEVKKKKTGSRFPRRCHAAAVDESKSAAWARDPGPPRCVVTTATGEKHACDYVVIALPLGVLQRRAARSTVEFEPELSESKRRAIACVGMGVENKVIMRFDEVFWPRRAKFFQCTDQRFRFLNLHAYGKQNTLCAHVAPPFGEGFDGMTDEEVLTEVIGTLRRMFKKNNAAASTRAKLLDHRVTRWGEDPFSCGAYSYMRVGSTKADIDALRAPEHDDRVHFAGEACSVEGAQCVHGALLTGQGAAAAILRACGAAVGAFYFHTGSHTTALAW